MVSTGLWNQIVCTRKVWQNVQPFTLAAAWSWHPSFTLKTVRGKSFSSFGPTSGHIFEVIQQKTLCVLHASSICVTEVSSGVPKASAATESATGGSQHQLKNRKKKKEACFLKVSLFSHWALDSFIFSLCFKSDFDHFVHFTRRMSSLGFNSVGLTEPSVPS